MKAKIQDNFGDKIVITEINGKANVETFKSTVDNVIQEFHISQKQNPQAEKYNIIKAAARIIYVMI